MCFELLRKIFLKHSIDGFDLFDRDIHVECAPLNDRQSLIVQRVSQVSRAANNGVLFVVRPKISRKQQPNFVNCLSKKFGL